jgi:hypothetical protein
MAKDRSLDDVEAANRVAIANATAAAHRAGIPYFEADSLFVYAVYPDGRRIVGRQIDISSAEEMKGLRQAVERAGGHPTF